METKNLTDEVLDNLDFTEPEEKLFKKIRNYIKLSELQGNEKAIAPSIKKMIEEMFNE